MCQILCAWEARGGLVKMWEVWWYPRCCIPSKLPGAARAPATPGQQRLTPCLLWLLTGSPCSLWKLQWPLVAHSCSCQPQPIRNLSLPLYLDVMHLELGPGTGIFLSCPQGVLIRQVVDGKGDSNTKLSSRTRLSRAFWTRSWAERIIALSPSFLSTVATHLWNVGLQGSLFFCTSFQLREVVLWQDWTSSRTWLAPQRVRKKHQME